MNVGSFRQQFVLDIIAREKRFLGKKEMATLAKEVGQSVSGESLYQSARKLARDGLIEERQTASETTGGSGWMYVWGPKGATFTGPPPPVGTAPTPVPVSFQKKNRKRKPAQTVKKPSTTVSTPDVQHAAPSPRKVENPQRVVVFPSSKIVKGIEDSSGDPVILHLDDCSPAWWSKSGGVSVACHNGIVLNFTGENATTVWGMLLGEAVIVGAPSSLEDIETMRSERDAAMELAEQAEKRAAQAAVDCQNRLASAHAKIAELENRVRAAAENALKQKKDWESLQFLIAEKAKS